MFSMFMKCEVDKFEIIIHNNDNDKFFKAPQAVENIQHVSHCSRPQKHDQQIQFPSTNKLNSPTSGVDNHTNYKIAGLKRYDPSSIDTEENTEPNSENQMKSIKTYYDGKRFWTLLSNSKSNYDNQK